MIIKILSDLAAIRRAWGLSVEEVAQRMACSPESLKKYEAALRVPNAKVLFKWAEVLGYELVLRPKKD